jgi:O-Antigen ligase
VFESGRTPPAMVAWPLMEAAPEPSLRSPRRPLTAAAATLLLLVGAALLGAGFAGDGSDVDGITPVGGAAVVLLGAALVAAAFGWQVLPRLDGAGVTLLTAMLLLAAWTGATVAWSIAPDRSWDTFNRSVAFTAFLGLGIVLAGAAGRVAARAAAALLSVVLAVVLAWALATKVVPSLDPQGDRVARLREPVEYWNALALLADVAIVLGLWLGASRGHRIAVRVAGGLLCYVAAIALALTLSRAGVGAAAAVVLLWLALSRERVESGLVLAAALIPAALVAGWAFTRPALTEDGATRADRVADGRWLGVLAVGGALVVAGLVAVGSRRSLADSTRRRLSRGLLAAAALVVVAAVVGVGVAASNAASSSSCAEIANDPSRLGSADLTNRWCWWNEAWDVFAANAPEGAGAGSFVAARKRFREDARNVVQPHSVPLQQLADGGVVALGLFALLVLAGLWTCVSVLRRLDEPERVAAAALVAAPAAFLLHSLVDYSWDFLAVTAPTMLALGVLAGAGRPLAGRRRRALLAVGAVLVGLTVLISFSAPRLADESVRDSTRALGEDDFSRAREHADWAELLNPLSVDPLFAHARVSERRNFQTAAERWYVDAVELQPENPETWYALGLFELDVRENPCDGYRFLNEAYTLDPKGQQWFPGGPLDVATDAVNEGACERGS